jgi:hypothetical protein
MVLAFLYVAFGNAENRAGNQCATAGSGAFVCEFGLQAGFAGGQVMRHPR